MDIFHQRFLRNYLIKKYEIFDNFVFSLKVLQPLMATAGGMWALHTSCYILICNMTTSRIIFYHLFQPTGWVAWCSELHYLWFDMQHEYFLKKNVLTFSPNLWVKGVCKDRICACMVLCVSFPLMWHEKWLLSLKIYVWLHPVVKGVCNDRIYACMVLCVPFPLTWYAPWLLSVKMFWPHPRRRGCL